MHGARVAARFRVGPAVGGAHLRWGDRHRRSRRFPHQHAVSAAGDGRNGARRVPGDRGRARAADADLASLLRGHSASGGCRLGARPHGGVVARVERALPASAYGGLLIAEDGDGKQHLSAQPIAGRRSSSPATTTAKAPSSPVPTSHPTARSSSPTCRNPVASTRSADPSRSSAADATPPEAGAPRRTTSYRIVGSHRRESPAATLESVDRRIARYLAETRHHAARSCWDTRRSPRRPRHAYHELASTSSPIPRLRLSPSSTRGL